MLAIKILISWIFYWIGDICCVILGALPDKIACSWFGGVFAWVYQNSMCFSSAILEDENRRLITEKGPWKTPEKE